MQISALDHEPAKILRAASRLVAGRDPSSRRHARPRCEQPDLLQRQLMQPMRRIEPTHKINQRNLLRSEIECLKSKFIDVIKRWIAYNRKFLHVIKQVESL